MKILNVFCQEPVVSIVNDRNIKFVKRCLIDVVTDEGVLSYDILPGFITNCRSGTSFIDGFVPHFGNNATIIAWVIHDCNYYELLSKDLADDILKKMLIKAGMSCIKANIVKKSVEWFGGNAYGLNTDDDITMRSMISFKWVHTNK